MTLNEEIEWTVEQNIVLSRKIYRLEQSTYFNLCLQSIFLIRIIFYFFGRKIHMSVKN